MAISLRLYSGAAPSSPLVGLLPDFSELSVQAAFNDPGSFSFRYDREGALAEQVTGLPDAAVAVLVDGVERFRGLVEDDSDDPTADVATMEVSGRGTAALLERAIVFPPNLGFTPTTVQLPNATVGTVLRTLVQRAQLRGGVAAVNVSSFTEVVDSAGVGWTKVFSPSYDAGTNVLAVLASLAADRLCDYRMDGTTLRVYNPDTVLGTDRPGMVLRRGRLTSAPRQRSRREIATDLLVLGESGVAVVRSDAAARNTYTRRESFSSESGILDSGTLATLGDARLGLLNRPQQGYTYAVDLTPEVAPDGSLVPVPQPWRDFNPGDYVRADTALTATGGYEPLRVRTMAVALAEDGGATVSLELNDLFLESAIRLALKVNGITNGSVTDVRPSDPVVDRLRPAAPASIAVTSDAYTDTSGGQFANASLSWPPVLVNEDGTAITDLAGYEVSWQVGAGVGGANWSGDVTVAGGGTTATASGFPLGASFVARVRAFDSNGYRSPYTSSARVTLAIDATAPPQPSAPVLVPTISGLRVTWDGRGSAGEAMPKDFAQVIVYVSTVAGFPVAAAFVRASLPAGGSITITELPFITHYVKLVAYDRAGNASPPSVERSSVPRRIAAADADPYLLRNTDHTMLTGASDANDAGTFLLTPGAGMVRAARSDGYDGTAITATAGQVAAGVFTTGPAYAGLRPGRYRATAYLQTFGLDAAGENPVRPTVSVSVFCPEPGAVPESGVWVPASRTRVFQVRAVSVLFTLNQPNAPVDVRVRNDRTDYTWHLSHLTIEPVAVMAVAEIGDAEIGNLSASKLVAGTINADITVATRITTAATGARAELNNTGLSLYRADGTLAAEMSPVLGQMRFYNTSDASVASGGHALQMGATTGPNLVIDNNEVMARDNSNYSTLYLNKDGGRVRLGGFPAYDGTGVGQPMDINHVVTVAGALNVLTARDANYADDYAPLILGVRNGPHLFADNNEIGAAVGNTPSPLFLNAPINPTTHHTEHISLSSSSVSIARWGSFSLGTHAGLVYGGDGDNNVGLKLDSGGEGLVSRVLVTDRQGNFVGAGEAHPIFASAFNVGSSRALKTDVEAVPAALAAVRAAPARRFRLRGPDNAADWHYGPMLEDLPADLRRRSDGDGEADCVSLGSMIGLLWEAVRELSARLDEERP